MGSDLRHYADALADKISIHAPRMGSDDGRVVGPVDGVLISIHAPRMGSDFSWRGLPPTVDISIHAPRMGSDLKRSDDMTQKILFQSTLPGWGATNRRYCSVSRMANFNPRSPDGERLHLIVDLRHRFGISIHAPRMGSDFQKGGGNHGSRVISIHAPRMGSDVEPTPINTRIDYFNPRSPDGERLSTISEPT